MDRTEDRTTDPAPVVTVVVPAFNEERMLPRSLGAIREASGAFAERGLGWELVVCDNNSTDRTAEVAREHGARVVFEPVNQIGRARNAGASVARGRWLLFVDADSEPTGPLFGEVARLVVEGRVVYAGAVVRFADGERTRVPTWPVHLWNLTSRVLRWMAGSFMLVDAEAFREVGGFNAKFFAGEEVDLSRRLKRWGRRRGRRGVIISREALTTSPRRLRLYSGREILGFTLKAFLRPWRTTASREACSMWYDGRR